MFTGIVRERGRVEAVERGYGMCLRVRSPLTAVAAIVGDMV